MHQLKTLFTCDTVSLMTIVLIICYSLHSHKISIQCIRKLSALSSSQH